ncbi:MAG: aminopeptidase [Candidatus Bathyarchaeia archaeon]
MKSWMRGANKVLKVCASVKRGERTLILTDPGIDPMVPISLVQAATEVGSEAIVATLVRHSANDEPPRRVVNLMLNSDVILSTTSVTMFYTNAKRKACERGARFLSMTGTTLDVLSSGAIEADFLKQKPLVERLAKRLTAAKNISIRTAAGTNVVASVKGRRAIPNTGICRKPGDSSGVPDIEVYVAPVEETVEGTAVIDGTISGIGLLRSPVKLKIHGGKVRSIVGGPEARMLRKIVRSQNDEKVYQIAEIGIGLNPKAILCGAIIEDESALGTAHLALGDNSKFGGRNPASTHIDNVFKRPLIELDGERLQLPARIV